MSGPLRYDRVSAVVNFSPKGGAEAGQWAVLELAKQVPIGAIRGLALFEEVSRDDVGIECVSDGRIIRLDVGGD